MAASRMRACKRGDNSSDVATWMTSCTATGQFVQIVCQAPHRLRKSKVMQVAKVSALKTKIPTIEVSGYYLTLEQLIDILLCTAPSGAPTCEGPGSE